MRIRIGTDTLFFLLVFSFGLLWSECGLAQTRNAMRSGPAQANHQSDSPTSKFTFNGSLDDAFSGRAKGESVGQLNLTSGLADQALRIGADKSPSSLILSSENLGFNSKDDFSIEFWIRTTVDNEQRFVVLSNKKFADNSLNSHKQKGWAFGVCNGTWAWNIGSGKRRLSYERDNGEYMSLIDGRWHQLVMTHESSSSLIRLYYDGANWVTYNVSDDGGFDFSSDGPLVIGWNGSLNQSDSILPAIREGAENLQALVDEFSRLDLPLIQPNELMDLVIEPKRLAAKKRRLLEKQKGVDDVTEFQDEALTRIDAMANSLMANPYTVHQVADFMKVAPLLKLYELKDGKITINQPNALEYTQQERLDQPEFDIDELSYWNRTIGPAEVAGSYSRHFQRVQPVFKKNLKSLTAAAFNIHHGGKHESIAEDGWDSRDAIAHLLKRENVDVVMMQETYSSGDFIAAELGYYFATTVDWDYLNQGANISVLSRYPIKEIYVPPGSSFMNVAARVSISQTQDIFVMSNWYGMRNFSDVFEFHKPRFEQSAKIPTLFAGDFNAVPHTDGGKSPASGALMDAGFADAFRELHPDVQRYPGHTHQNGRRIDQLYYTGAGLKNNSTTVLSTWPSKFPSDHYLIRTVFDLNYRTYTTD